MRTFLRVIEKYHFILIFLLLEVVSFYLIINYNQTQREIFLNSSNRFASFFLEISGNIKGYFFLRKANEDLLRENAYLRTLLPELTVSQKETAISKYEVQNNNLYNFQPARVINNSINKSNNYITLNKGSKHNVSPGSGVISARGLVGIVSNVSNNHAAVISLINTKFRVSAKLRDSDYFGSLSWDGKSYQHAVLSEIPSHAPVRVGEAVVTSGYSAIFPEGILIGTVESYEIGKGEGFYNIRIKLSVDFKNITYVETVEKITAHEQYELEKETIDD